MCRKMGIFQILSNEKTKNKVSKQKFRKMSKKGKNAQKSFFFTVKLYKITRLTY